MSSTAARHRAALFCLTVLLGSVFAHDAFAQAPVPPPATPGAVPPPPAWHGFVSGGVTLQAGITDQRGLNLGGGLAKVAPIWSQSLEADLAYLKVKGTGYDQVVTDAQNVRYTAQRNLSSRVYLALRPAFKRNEVQRVDYRFEELVGIGFRVAQAPHFQMSVIPIGGAVQQEKNIPGLNNNTATAGVLQTIALPVNKVTSISQFFLYEADLRNTNDNRVQLRAELTNAIVGPLGLQVIYSLDRENLVLGGQEGTDSRVELRFQIKF